MAIKQELKHEVPSSPNKLEKIEKQEKLRLGPQNLSMDAGKMIGKPVHNDPSPNSITEVESGGSTGKFADQRQRGQGLVASFKQAHEQVLKPKKLRKVITPTKPRQPM